jgi:hypothetical protein
LPEGAVAVTLSPKLQHSGSGGDQRPASVYWIADSRSSANANALFSFVITSLGSLPSFRSSRTIGIEASP